MDQLDQFVDAVCARASVDRNEIVIGGFSQGAGIAAWLAYGTTSSPPAGLWCCGTIFDVAGRALDLTTAAGTNVLILAGRDDPNVPLERNHQQADRLRAAGAHVAMSEHDGGHGLSQPMLADMRHWLEHLDHTDTTRPARDSATSAHTDEAVEGTDHIREAEIPARSLHPDPRVGRRNPTFGPGRFQPRTMLDSPRERQPGRASHAVGPFAESPITSPKIWPVSRSGRSTPPPANHSPVAHTSWDSHDVRVDRSTDQRRGAAGDDRGPRSLGV